MNIKSTIMITGHRGAALLAPENTLVGIERAAQSGAQWVEIDTQLTADDIPVIIHDQSVNRCTNGEGKVSELDLKTLKTLDAGSWFHNDFAGTRIPTLVEALNKCVELNLSLNLEIKLYGDDQAERLVKAVAETITTHQYPLDRLLISSFSADVLSLCRRYLPKVRLGYICEQWHDDILEKLNPLDLFSVHIDHKALTPNIAKSILKQGFILKIWTLNDPEKVQYFYDLGVNNIITDMPDQLQ